MNYQAPYQKPTAKTDKTYYQGSFVGFVSTFSRGKTVPSLEKLKAILREKQSDKEGFVSFGSTFSGTEENSDKPDPDLDAILSMRLSEFSRSGLWIHIHSKILGEDIILAADDAGDIPEGLPVYRAEEVKSLMAMKIAPDELSRIHNVKKSFGGVIQRVEKVEK